MTWYLAPAFSQVDDFTDPDPANWTYALTCPGSGTPLAPYTLNGAHSVRAYTSSTCLVGCPTPIEAPPDWTVKTVADAAALFTAAAGRAPSAQEIY